MVLERRDAVAALGAVVGVEVAGRTRHVDTFPTEEHADAADQVHGADDCTLLAVDLAERPQARRPALTPEPDLRGRPLAGGTAGLVDRVVVENLPAPPHQLAEQVAARSLWKKIGN